MLVRQFYDLQTATNVIEALGLSWYGHLYRGALALLFLIGCLLMGAFVTVYNYAGFRLTGAPSKLSPAQISPIFPVYLFGMVGSSAAGALSDRHGRGPVLIAGSRFPASAWG
jgi:MFS transporter, YNFM family, putative membrane transport protein